jgi:hypothetical protein
MAHDWKSGSYGEMAVDTVAAGAAMVPGPIGMVGGAWTWGKAFRQSLE